MNARPAIALFGGFSRFTLTTLELLIAERLQPKVVVLAAYGPSQSGESDGIEIRRRDAPAISSLCLSRNIPIVYYTQDTYQLARVLEKFKITVCVLACYPKIFPVSEFTSKLTFVNIHPSILPRFRGIDPLFWQLRSGEEQTGFTIHHVDARIDSGRIIASEPVAFPAGARLGEIQACVLRSAVAKLTELLANDPEHWPACDQDEQFASIQRAPCAEDLWVSTAMSARTAFNFVRAVRGEYRPLMLNWPGNNSTEIVDAVSYSDDTDNAEFETPADTELLQVAFSNGTVCFAVAP